MPDLDGFYGTFKALWLVFPEERFWLWWVSIPFFLLYIPFKLEIIIRSLSVKLKKLLDDLIEAQRKEAQFYEEHPEMKRWDK